MIRERIEEKLRAAFQPVFLEVVDESGDAANLLI